MHLTSRRPGILRRERSRTGLAFRADALEPRTLLAAPVLFDVNTNPASSAPAGFAVSGSTAYFSANSRESETGGIWKTDGTDAGTSPFELLPGATAEVVNGTVFLFAADPSGPSGLRLWKSDGTPGGTVLLSPPDVQFDSVANGPPNRLTALDGAVYFWGIDPVHGRQVWKTDGTPAGTVRVTDLRHGQVDWFGNIPLTPFESRLFFQSYGVQRTELWSTDGTSEGTIQVPDPDPTFSLTVKTPTATDTTVLFVTSDAAHGQELWKTDGTAAGTQLVKDIYAGPRGSDVSLLRSFGHYAYFTAFSTGSQSASPELWRTDGTEAGTVELPPVGRMDAARMVEANGRVFITGQDHNALWSTDGSPEGTVLITANPVEAPLAVGDRVFFQSNGGLWITDGTVAGTRRLGAVSTAVPWYLAREAVGAGGKYFFNNATPETGTELWASDGTPAGTALLKDAMPGPTGSDPKRLTRFGDRVLYSATTSDGEEPWITDGTPDGTRMVKDVYPGTASSNPYSLTDRDGTLHFTVLWDFPGGAEPFLKIDPAAAAPTPFDGPLPPVTEMIAAGGKLFFNDPDNIDGLGDPELWVGDGTDASLHSVYYGLNYSTAWLTDVGGRVFFSDDELWLSDGTERGTRMVRDINPGAAISNPTDLADVGGTLFFAADDGVHGRELWKSDGTAAGTVLVRDIVAGPDGSAPDGLVDVDGTLFFRAGGPDGTWLWKSDGTADGTVPVAPLSAQPPRHIAFRSYYEPFRFGAALDGVLYFANGDDAGLELWRSDGTREGTYRLKDINAGPGDSGPQWFEAVEGKVYFSAADPAAGRELWMTDGTAGGTVRAADVNPGPDSSNPKWLTASGGVLWFNAAGAVSGKELWKLSPDPAPARVVARHVFRNDSAADGHDPASTWRDDPAVAYDKRPLPPGAAPSSANVTGDARGINGVMIDVANLPAGAALTADDFAFRSAAAGATHFADGPAPIQVSVRRGAGVERTDRVTVTWADATDPGAPAASRAVGNGWLEVTLRSDARTGLAAPDTFTFGNLAGDTGGAGVPAVDGLDVAETRRHLSARDPAALARYDFTGDGRIDRSDLLVVLRNAGGRLAPPPFDGSDPGSAPTPPSNAATGRRRTGHPRRGLLQDPFALP